MVARTVGLATGPWITRCDMGDQDIVRCADCGAWTWKKKPRDHDPLCIGVYRGLIPVDLCQYCSLIERVRDDERRRLAANTD